ncbi:MAG: hypothetical protein VXX85_02545 [Candidatus Margulisiibacteriota bacterium]|nr:hypothetical protein [Candidatus Margulisiibacteriota bacterium]
MKKLILLTMILFVAGCASSSNDSNYTLSDEEKVMLTDLNSTEFAWN